MPLCSAEPRDGESRHGGLPPGQTRFGQTRFGQPRKAWRGKPSPRVQFRLIVAVCSGEQPLVDAVVAVGEGGRAHVVLAFVEVEAVSRERVLCGA